MRDNGTAPDDCQNTREGEHFAHSNISGSSVIVAGSPPEKSSRLILQFRRGDP
jgi:hypothetical protein